MEEKENIINGHEYVDLGLSVLWATCNVGAEKPEDYGDYYAWGETETKYSYDEAVCETMGKDIDDISGTCLDVAHVKWGSPYLKWGGGWRMPTEEEFEELYNNCNRDWIFLRGVKVGKLTSNINRKSIFLPAGGYKDELSLELEEEEIFYWSSTPGVYGDRYAYYFNNIPEVQTLDCIRYDGMLVRPVAEKILVEQDMTCDQEEE